MEKRVALEQARQAFGKVMQDVSLGENVIVVDDEGNPLAAVVPFRLYQAWQRDDQAFFTQTREISTRIGMTDEEAMIEVLAAIEEMRKEERAQEAQMRRVS
jgi:antitoxin (DNA-binding transcriptional repressor) of toxin-antitoxin stability system